MKIEKLTENKIRVVLNSNDLKLKNIDMKSLSKALEKQTFFIGVLEKAKEQLGFETDGHKLLIETFTFNDDIIIFTITKYLYNEKKKTIVKKEILNNTTADRIYTFKDFDEFCSFCNCIKNSSNLNYKILSKNVSLYLYKNTYYLLIKNINTSYKNQKLFFSLISEFSKTLPFSSTFENRLIEYGKEIIKKNAIDKGIKYFS